MSSTLPPEPWLPLLQEQTLRSADRLNFYGLRAQQLGPAHTGIFQTAVEDLAAATEALRVVEEEARVQGEHLSASLRELEAARDRYRELFNSITDAYVETDANGIIREGNQAVSALIGYARTYVLGKPLAALIDPGSVEQFRTRLAGLQQMGDGQVQSWETYFRGRRTGKPVPVKVHVTAIRDRSGAPGLRWSLRDVSDYKALEERLARLHAEQERMLRTRTMELEAVVRMRDEALAHERAMRERVEARWTTQNDAIVCLAWEAIRLWRGDPTLERAADEAAALIDDGEGAPRALSVLIRAVAEAGAVAGADRERNRATDEDRGRTAVGGTGPRSAGG